MECSICLDCVDPAKNSVTTECGHCFHASCLMKNVAHNGFGCPYCRAEMAEVPEDSDDEDYEEDDEDYEDEDEDYEFDLLDDYSLRGFRWLFQRAEGEELDDEEDIEIDDEYNEDSEQINDANIPPWSFVAHRLLQRGVTSEMLVRALLSTSHREYRNNRECDVSRNAILGGIRVIVDGFRPYELETLERDIQQEEEKKEFEIERRVRLRLRALGHHIDDLDSELDSDIVR